jgi:HK97 family phage prohead protease
MSETRSLEVRDIDEDHGGFTARVVKYNTADHHGSVWRPAVFRASLERSLPVSCWSHDLSRPIGRAVDYEDSGRHLDTHVRLADPDDVPDARMARSLLKDKIVDGFSFTFDRHQKGTLPVPREQRSSYGSLPARELVVGADLIEISPVVAPSGLGTGLLAIRSQEGPTIMGETTNPGDIAILVQTEVITPQQGQALFLEHLKANGRERILLSSSQTVEQRVRECLEEYDSDLALEARALTMTVGAPMMPDPDEDAGTLASAVDAALDSACDLVDGTDLTSLPDNVQQALALTEAAGVAVDELLDVMGIDDPDQGERSRELENREKVLETPWNFKASDYSQEQLQRACLIKTGDGSTKDDLKLPIRTPDGTLVKGAITAAAGALAGARGGVDAPQDDKVAAAKTLVGIYNSSLKMKPPASLLKLAGSSRDLDDTETRDLAEKEQRALELLGRRR